MVGGLTGEDLAPARDAFVLGETLDALESSAGWESAFASIFGVLPSFAQSGLGGLLNFGPPTRLESGVNVYNEVAIQRITDEY